ncbi:hypothetical protein SAMN05660830_02726 [Halodesulfovibrio aestuarii]|uniref:Alginate export domain-containing protein n=2 Tax=Halodesulfovibrio aestuarii TaxID=126333 RepID=A0A8G2F9W1_9BACT|nr:hypothetical protein SAMN05660830_02726 [Halodesulfovibrio aestuarii]
MRRAVFCLVCFLLMCSSAVAEITGDPFAESEAFDVIPVESDRKQLIQIGGYMESRNQLAVRDFSMPVSVLQRLSLGFSASKEDVNLFASTYLEQELAAFTWKNSDYKVWDVRPREIYVEYDKPGLNLFIGKRFMRWGSADGINPLDVVNPVDVVDPISTGRSNTRTPVFMSGLEVVQGDWSIEAVFLPVAAVQGIPLYGTPWEPEAIKALREMERAGCSVDVQDGNEPDRWFQQVEYGVHISTVLKGVDLEGVFFHGYENSPVWQSVAGDRGTVVFPEYKEFSALGFIFAKGFEKNTLRGEFAYKPDYPCVLNDSCMPGRVDLFQAVLGWDYDIDGIYYCNLQVFGEGYGIGSRHEFYRHGVTYSVNGTWLADTLTVGVRGQIYTDGQGAQTELFADYVITDNWNLYSGIMLWSGAPDSFLGQYGDNDFVYCTLRYSF